MARRMLVNASRRSEIRAAILDDKRLDIFESESAVNLLKKGNIYVGRVTTVESSLDACFVDYGCGRDGFLPAWDIHPGTAGEKANSTKKNRIFDLVRKGQKILVQVTKEEIGNKGAGLSTYISLPSRYFVLMPFEKDAKISRKIPEKEKERLKEIVDSLSQKGEYGLIARSAAEGQRKTDLEKDLRYLIRLWETIVKVVSQVDESVLIFRENDLVVRFLRDYYTPEIKEIIFDSEEALKRADEYFNAISLRQRPDLFHYQDRMPLLTHFEVEHQIEEIYKRQVILPSGGNIVIDQTEALIAIDVNSAKNRNDNEHEETVFKTNMEAAKEVARQLRLRDMGGIIIIDFIDMMAIKHKKAVEKCFKDAVKADRARIDISRISKNGLMELTRQRMKQSLWQQKYRTCPTCKGEGMIRSADSVWLSILRRIETEAQKGTLYEVKAAFHPEIADYIQNARRPELLALEQEFSLRIILKADSSMHRADEHIDFFHTSGAMVKPRMAEAAPLISLAVPAYFMEEEEENIPDNQQAAGNDKEKKPLSSQGETRAATGTDSNQRAGAGKKGLAGERAETEKKTVPVGKKKLLAQKIAKKNGKRPFNKKAQNAPTKPTVDASVDLTDKNGENIAKNAQSESRVPPKNEGKPQAKNEGKPQIKNEGKGPQKNEGKPQAKNFKSNWKNNKGGTKAKRTDNNVRAEGAEKTEITERAQDAPKKSLADRSEPGAQDMKANIDDNKKAIQDKKPSITHIIKKKTGLIQKVIHWDDKDKKDN